MCRGSLEAFDAHRTRLWFMESDRGWRSVAGAIATVVGSN